mmetsp:Transcript_3937/g.10110  ORF Transcript_3937/g.10110 Transcript_3937/m.10110 type:complete len:260 (-) Transcript_3937:1379-2158(-)
MASPARSVLNVVLVNQLLNDVEATLHFRRREKRRRAFASAWHGRKRVDELSVGGATLRWRTPYLLLRWWRRLSLPLPLGLGVQVYWEPALEPLPLLLRTAGQLDPFFCRRHGLRNSQLVPPRVGHLNHGALLQRGAREGRRLGRPVRVVAVAGSECAQHRRVLRQLGRRAVESGLRAASKDVHRGLVLRQLGGDVRFVKAVCRATVPAAPRGAPRRGGLPRLPAPPHRNHAPGQPRRGHPAHRKHDGQSDLQIGTTAPT